MTAVVTILLTVIKPEGLLAWHVKLYTDALYVWKIIQPSKSIRMELSGHFYMRNVISSVCIDSQLASKVFPQIWEHAFTYSQ